MLHLWAGSSEMGRAVSIILVIFLALFLIGKCAGNNETSERLPENAIMDNGSAMDGFDSPALPPTAEGEPVSVPSDPGATYRLLRWSRLPNGNLEAVTRRDGSSGTSFARREIDCRAMTFRYLGEGDTLEQALADSPNPGQMGELTSQSISTYVSEFVCRKAGR
jgi:hypothetical protein